MKLYCDNKPGIMSIAYNPVQHDKSNILKLTITSSKIIFDRDLVVTIPIPK